LHALSGSSGSDNERAILVHRSSHPPLDFGATVAAKVRLMGDAWRDDVSGNHCIGEVDFFVAPTTLRFSNHYARKLVLVVSLCIHLLLLCYLSKLYTTLIHKNRVSVRGLCERMKLKRGAGLQRTCKQILAQHKATRRGVACVYNVEKL
jgi:hypothetical protein